MLCKAPEKDWSGSAQAKKSLITVGDSLTPPGYPRKQIIQNRPYYKRNNKSCQTFFIKCKNILPYRQKLCTSHHYKQRYSRTHKRAIETSPKIIPRFRPFCRSYIIRTMYCYHHKNSNKLHKVKPYNSLVVFINQ